MYRVFYSAIPTYKGVKGSLEGCLINPSKVYNHYLTPECHIPDQDFPELTEDQAEYICLVLDKVWGCPTYKSFETKEVALAFVEYLKSPEYTPATLEPLDESQDYPDGAFDFI